VSVAELRRTFANLAEIPATAIAEATALVEQIAADTGRPVRIKGKTYQLTATTRIQRQGDGMTATVYGKPTGFWVWQNTGTKPHAIAPAKGTRKHRARVIVPNGGHPQSVPVRHPGASGRGRWREVQQRARREVPQIFRDTVDDIVRKAG
jgi:hypothetical protein